MFQTDLSLVNYGTVAFSLLCSGNGFLFFSKLWFGGLGGCMEGKTQFFILMNLGLNSSSTPEQVSDPEQFASLP